MAFLGFLQKKQDELETIPLNIAVIGPCSVGKSSFINAIRNVKADEPGAADVDCIETTKYITPYTHPNNERLKLWDLPGVGSVKFPQETYLEHVAAASYDFFLLLSATKFTEIDVWLHNEIVNKLGKKLFYVRTKIGDDLRNHPRAQSRTNNEDCVLPKIRESIEANLRAIGSEHVKVFLIDSHEQNKYDFQQLQQSLIDDFPDMKRQALILSLYAFSDSMIKTKADALRKLILRSATFSAFVAFIPIPGVSLAFDTIAALFMAKYYHKQLGLDEISLRRHAQLTSTDPQMLLRFVSDTLGFEFLTIQGIEALLKKYGGSASAGVVVGSISEEFVRSVPFVGSVLAGAMSFGGTYLAHKIIINKLEQVALEVYKYAVENGVQPDNNDEVAQ